MKVIDLTKISKSKIKSEIDLICGGQSLEDKWLSGLGRGLGGFIFTDPQILDEQNSFKCNLAFYKEGMGIYFRNIYSNYLVLIHEDEIAAIEIRKLGDTIMPYKYSFYSLLVKAGFDPIQSSVYLMPKEIKEEFPAQCILRLRDVFFTFQLENISIIKLKNTFLKSRYAKYLTVDVSSPIFLNR